MIQDQPTSERLPNKTTKVIAAFISVCLVALGLITIYTRHYYGETTKSGGAVVNFYGSKAVWMGFGQVVFGLFPLAFWAKSGRAAGIWAGGCLILGISLIIGAAYYYR